MKPCLLFLSTKLAIMCLDVSTLLQQVLQALVHAISFYHTSVPTIIIALFIRVTCMNQL